MSTQRDPIRISITDPVLIRVAALAEQRGVDAYVVGGYVRDALMGRPRTDIDITVVGDPIEFARLQGIPHSNGSSAQPSLRICWHAKREI